jgi:hypothetical protein
MIAKGSPTPMRSPSTRSAWWLSGPSLCATGSIHALDAGLMAPTRTRRAVGIRAGDILIQLGDAPIAERAVDTVMCSPPKPRIKKDRRTLASTRRKARRDKAGLDVRPLTSPSISQALA